MCFTGAVSPDLLGIRIYLHVGIRVRYYILDPDQKEVYCLTENYQAIKDLNNYALNFQTNFVDNLQPICK